MKRGWAGPAFWAAAAIAAVSVGLAAGPLPWRFAGESGLPAPEAGPAAAERVSVDGILALAPFGRLVQPETPAAPASETALGLVLHGVVIAARPEASSAMISGPSEPLRSYTVGQAVAEGATLSEVQGDHVVLAVDGRAEILSFPDQGRTAGASATSSGVDRLRALVVGAEDAPETPEPEAAAAEDDPDAVINRYRERIAQNPQTVLDGLGLVASEEGYRVGEDAGPGVRRAGLQPGDVVAKVNGQQVGNIERDRDLFDAVAASGRARIELLRDGQRIVLSFPLR